VYRVRLENEKDPEILRKAALLLERENGRLVQKIVELTRELMALKGESAEQLKLRIAELERQLAVKNRILFGDKSERREGDESREPTPEPPKPPQTGHGPKPQPKLPLTEVVHEHDEADKVCPACGDALQAWEGQFEESEEIDVIERRFVLKKHKRQKYRCRCGGCIETAPGPVKLFEGRAIRSTLRSRWPSRSMATTCRSSARCARWRARGSRWIRRRSGIRSSASHGCSGLGTWSSRATSSTGA